MKKIIVPVSFLRLAVIVAVIGIQQVQAASSSWSSTATTAATGSWTTTGNWLNGNIPGTAGGTTSTDIATFGTVLTQSSTVTVDNGRNIGGIIFSNTTNFGYVIASGTLRLSTSGTIQRVGTVLSGTNLITSSIQIQGDGGTATFANYVNGPATSVLNFTTGTISGVSTASNTTILTLSGTHTGSNNVNDIITDGTSGGKLAIVKSEAGRWNLAGNNTFSGGVTLNAGTLGLQSSVNVLGTGVFTINGGTILQGNATATNFANAITVGGDFAVNANSGTMAFLGNVDLGGTTRTISPSNTTNSLTFSGTISGSSGVGLIKSGAGLMTLSGSNTYTGATTVSQGELSVNKIANSGAASAVGAGSTIAIGSNTTSGTLTYTGAGDTTNRTLDLSGSATINANGGGALVFANNLTVSGTAVKSLTLSGTNTGNNEIRGIIADYTATVLAKTSLFKTGSGTWIISGANTYTGGTLISDGILKTGSNNTITGGAITINKGTLDLNGYTNAMSTTAGTLNLGSATPASIGATANIVDTVGTGKLILGAGVTYNAGTTGNNNGQALISANVDLGSATRIFTIGDSDQATVDMLISGVISGTAAAGVGITKTGAGVLGLSNANTYTGVTTINNGTIQYGANNAIASGTTLIVSATNAGTTATLDLHGFSGSVGALNLGGSGGTSTSVNQVLTSSGTLTITSISVASTGNPTTSALISGNVDLNGAQRIINVSDSTGADVDLNMNAVLSGTGASGISKAGAGTMLLSQAVTYAGNNQITQGTIRFGVDNAFSNSSSSMTIRGGQDSILDLNGFNASIGSLTFGGLSGSGTSNYQVITGVGTLTMNGNFTYTNTGSTANTALISGNLDLGGATRTFNVGDSTAALIDVNVTAAISNGGLTKTGAGTLMLGSTASPVNNTYAGLTTVSAGTLIINGTVGGGGITVGSGAILGGNLTAGGTTTIQSGATLAVGNSPGLGTFAALNLSGTTEIQFNANATPAGRGTEFDAITVTGSNALSYGGTLKLFFGGALTNNQTFDIFNLAGSSSTDFASVTLFGSGTSASLSLVSGTWSGNADLGYGGGLQTFQFSQLTGDLNVIPEPQTWALVGLGLGFTLLRLRSHNRRKS